MVVVAVQHKSPSESRDDSAARVFRKADICCNGETSSKALLAFMGSTVDD
jgi:hypothetical protein